MLLMLHLCEKVWPRSPDVSSIAGNIVLVVTFTTNECHYPLLCGVVNKKIRFYADNFLACLRICAYTAKMSTTTLESPSMQTLDRAKIKTLREAMKLTQAEAAKRAGMTLTRWNDVESGGRANVTIDTLGRMADALECTSQDLLTQAEKKTRKGK